MKQQNELNAAEGIAQIITDVTGTKYTVGRSPDEEKPVVKEVDFLLMPESNNSPWLAMEHTRVEAFEHQMTYTNKSYDIVSQVADRCDGNLPQDRYYILVVADFVHALRKKEIARFVDTVSAWIMSTACELQIDQHQVWHSMENEVLLICGGSHPLFNGTIGRIPRGPNQSEALAASRLWRSVEHGLQKFKKYKDNGYDTVLSLQNITGEVYPSMLVDILADVAKGPLADQLIDYVIVFASVGDSMIVGNVWKEKKRQYNLIPFNRRYENKNGVWVALE